MAAATRSSKTTRSSPLTVTNQPNEIQAAVQIAISKFLKSEDFKSILKEYITEAMSDTLQRVVEPLKDKIIELEAKVKFSRRRPMTTSNTQGDTIFVFMGSVRNRSAKISKMMVDTKLGKISPKQ